MLVVGVAVVLFFISPPGHRAAATIFSPFVSIVNYVVDGARNAVKAIQPGRITARQELEEARRRIDELEAQVAALQDLVDENEELRRLASLPPPESWRAIKAEVISRDPENWNEKLLVNRGTADGVVTGAAVLVDGKVFGLVIRCYRHSSEVVTVLSSECRFGVAIANTSAVGVLQGRGDELLANGHRGFTVDYLPKDLSVESYQAVVTSGLGGWMPPGILVGTVVPDSNGRLIEYPEAARASVKCLPVAEFGAFHFLSIIVPDND